MRPGQPRKKSAPSRLAQLDQALAPLRRYIPYLQKAGDDVLPPGSEANVRRLLSHAREVADEPLAEEVLGEIAGMWPEADDGASDADTRLATSWQLLHRLDAVLGMPVRRPPLRPVQRVRPVVPKPVPVKQQASKLPTEAELVSPPPPKVIWEGRRLDLALTDIRLPYDWLEPLEARGMSTMWDLLSYRAAEEEILAPVHGAGRGFPPGRVAVGGRVRRRVTRLAPDGTTTAEIVLFGAGPLRVVWHRPFTHEDLAGLIPGDKVVVCGTSSPMEGEELVLHDAQLAFSTAGRAHVLHYGLEEAEQTYLDVLAAVLPELQSSDDVLPTALVQRQGLMSQGEALRVVHTEGSIRAAARERMAFDELFAAQLGRSFMGMQQSTGERGVSHAISHKQIGQLHQSEALSYLRDDAQLAFEDIKRDLYKPQPMFRVLVAPSETQQMQVAIRAALMVAEARSQVLLVAPDRGTARALYAHWEPIFTEAGHASMLLEDVAERQQREALRKGDVALAVAIPSFLQKPQEWRRLGLVIVQEAENYGANLSKARALRTPKPDVLVIPTTTLPVQRMFDAYASLDISLLTSPVRPRGAARSRTFLPEERAEAYNAVSEAVARGVPAVVAFPTTREGLDLVDLEQAEAWARAIARKVPEGARVAVLHSSLPVPEIQRILNDFSERRVDVLVSSAKVEFLAEVPKGTVLLVEQADRMPPRRLLELRGMVLGRGTMHMLLSEALEDEQRKAFFRDLHTGIEESQMVQRHPHYFEADGQLTGREQPGFRWANLGTDMALLVAARKAVHELLRSDPGLQDPKHARLVRWSRAVWPRIYSSSNPLPRPRKAPVKRRRRRRRKRSVGSKS